jgi:peptidyl-prolyl cis-trans isomerase SurA
MSSRRFATRRAAVLGAVLATALVSACRSTPAAPTVSADAWAVVDGHEIKRDDVEKAFRRTRDAGSTATDEETLIAKMSLLDEMIVQQILLAKAATLKIEVPQAEVDAADANARKNITPEALQQELVQRGLTAADMRESLRREMLAQKVITQEVDDKVTVSDKDVTDFFNANRAQFNLPEESYHLAQIVITPAREAQITNGTGDDATTPQAANAKVQMIMERLKAGASFRELASGYSEDAESAPRGGDLGLMPVSRLQQAPPQLRDAVLGKAPGSVNVAAAGGAYTLVLVVSREPAGQRDLSTPGVKDQLTQSLKARKQQVLRAAYIAAARTDADITNYLARQVVASKGAAPAPAAAAAPGS